MSLQSVTTPVLLALQDVHAFYGKSHILHGVTLEVRKGEIVSLLGRNGAGRSTMLKAIMGDLDARGSIRFRGQEVSQLRPHEIAYCGIGYVPENRDIFSNLTVLENLILGRKRGQPGRWTLDDIYALFPVLRERSNAPAGALSGGEQQMLTICRTLMGDPDLIMIDEPTEGLAPRMVEMVGRMLADIAARGVSILLVEQKLVIALDISHRLYVMGHGEIVFEGTPDALRSNANVRSEWLEV